jgi:dienelactone hydrolase
MRKVPTAPLLPRTWQDPPPVQRHRPRVSHPSPSLCLVNLTPHRIASFGYIVVTIDHPYDVDIVVFPNNTTITAIDDIDSSPLQILAAVKTRTKDISFVLNQFARPSDTHALLPDLPTGAIDTSKVGIFGHSLGGASAAEAMLYDRRFLGGINLDGMMFGDVLERGLDRPFMIFAHEGKNRITDATWGAIWPKLRSFKKELTVKGSAHGTFTDLPDVLKVLGIGAGLPSEVEQLLGSLDGARALEIVSVYVRVFFDRVLKGEEGGLLDGPSRKYPEVSFASP